MRGRVGSRRETQQVGWLWMGLNSHAGFAHLRCFLRSSARCSGVSPSSNSPSSSSSSSTAAAAVATHERELVEWQRPWCAHTGRPLCYRCKTPMPQHAGPANGYSNGSSNGQATADPVVEARALFCENRCYQVREYEILGPTQRGVH